MMNFKILQVDNMDLISSSNDEASAFERSEEPITTVVKRTSPVDFPVKDNWKKLIIKSGVCVSTQTEQSFSQITTSPKPSVCFCQHLMQLLAASNDSSVLSTLAMNELMRLSNKAVQHSNLQSSKEKLNFSVSTEEDDDVFEGEKLEVVLERPSLHHKLGIVLRDHRSPADSSVFVYISDIVKNSIADKSKRLKSGDKIISINGHNVNTMSQAASVLSKCSSVAFLLTRAYNSLNSCPQHQPSTVSSHSQLSINRVIGHYSTCNHQSNNSKKSSINTELHNSQETLKEINTKLLKKCTVAKPQTTTEVPNTVQQISKCEEESNKVVSSHHVAHEFTFIQPKDYDHVIKPTRFIGVSAHLKNEQKDSKTQLNESRSHKSQVKKDYRKVNDLERLVAAIESLETEQLKDEAYDEEGDEEEGLDLVDSTSIVVSPWVKIAREDYENVIRAENSLHITSNDSFGDKQARFSSHQNKICENGKRELSVGTDSTSSAYSTGESMRSSSTASGSSISIVHASRDQMTFDEDEVLMQSSEAENIERSKVDSPLEGDVAKIQSNFEARRRSSVKSGWKVKIRKDGTRYITKRPSQQHSDSNDSRITECQTRQKPQNHRCERRRRRKQKSRLEALHEHSCEAAREKSSEVNRHRATRRKRMLLGNFQVVQEILAYGRSGPSEAAEGNSLLSVTYI